MSKRVVITGAGAVSGFGLGCGTLWNALKGGKSCIRMLDCIDDPGESLKVRIGAQIPNYDPSQFFHDDEIAVLDRHTQFALLAAQEAVSDAGLATEDLVSAGIVLGTGCGGKETDEQTYRRLYLQGKSRVHPLTIPRGMPSAAASQLSIRLGVSGPVFCLSSACASANHALIQSQLMIRSGLVDIVITGGADAPFTFGLLKAWEAMRVLSLDGCRPFSRDRNGLVLGEGAGIVILESLEHAVSRGVGIYAELAGCGMSADAGHITSPSSDGPARAMRCALKDGEIAPEEVGYVNAHGTGTIINDPLETRSLREVFGAHAYRMAVSSTKSMHGHTLGAAGGLELIATLFAMRDSRVPPTINFSEPGEGCDLDYVPNQCRAHYFDVAVSNSFAFGGLNAVVAVRRIH